MKLTDPIFSDADKTRAHFEAIYWPTGPVCPHCGEAEKVYRVAGNFARPGLIHCNACEGQFAVTKGCVVESSHIPLNKWALGFYLYAASKKGFSAHQLPWQLGISYKSAWFIAHHIREAMAPAEGSELPLVGSRKVVEADETGLAPSRKTPAVGGKALSKNKRFVALVERNGKARSKVITEKGMHEIHRAVFRNVDAASVLHTDGAQFYKSRGSNWALAMMAWDFQRRPLAPQPSKSVWARTSFRRWLCS